MKYFVIFISLFLVSFCAEAQTNKTTPPIASSISTTNYVIGIGNQDLKLFLEVLNYTKTTLGSRVYAVCETQQVVGIVVRDREFKSYDVLRDALLDQFPTLMLLRKDDTIFNLDCKNETLKQ